MVVISTTKKSILVLCVTVLAVAVLPHALHGVTGFEAKLYSRPERVSTYRAPSEEYSVSLGKPRFPRVSRVLKRSPVLQEASFEHQSLRFNTELYKRGRYDLWMIPVSVDAEKYSASQRRYNRKKEFNSLGAGRLRDSRRDSNQGGLGLSVDLPDRLQGIFGEGGAGLRVSGYRKIMFSGRSQWTDAAESPVYTQSKFPSLHMEQQSRFDITGTIGSKITVKVSQDSQTDIPLSNRIQIRYKGGDDDILKTIEAGNTNLRLPQTSFVGYSSNIRGLFGLKAEAQVGNLYLTGIASQEKGSSERTKITPTGEESAKIIRDNEYEERRIFDLMRDGELQAGHKIVSMFVYEEWQGREDTPPAEALKARMVINPNAPDSFVNQDAEFIEPQAYVVPVPPEEFEYFSIPDSNRHYIVFTGRRRDIAIGVQMDVQRGSDTLTIGSISDTALLKLIYSPSADPTWVTWDLMWRNCYTIPKGTTIEDIEIKVYQGIKGTENDARSVDYQDTDLGTQKYLEITGLDQYDATNTRLVPDGQLDDRFGIFKPEWGLLIFPDRRPFDTDTTFALQSGETQPLEERVPGIYDYTSGTVKSEASKYFLKLFTKSRSTIIRLGRPNIIEGSETVTLNGRQLQRGTDYSIQYDFGQITLLTEEAADPNADIDIDFEYAPFLAVQQKTLLGFRAEYEWSKDLKLGSTVLYKSDKAQDRKPRVGQETAKAVVYDIDGSLGLRPNFLTTLANALPFVSTESPSNMQLSGEIAQSHPNPNVEGEAFIDDFEASAEQLSLGTGRTVWKKSSTPVPIARDPEGWERSRLLWHNPREPLNVEDVYARDTDAGAGTIRSLRLVLRPNYLDTLWDTTVVDEDTTYSIIDIIPAVIPKKSWAGITRYFGGRIDGERAQLFEIRARAQPGAVMHIEFGKISEDIDGDGIAFNEDNSNVGEFLDTEDVGLDGLPDVGEPRYDPETNPDPNGDNWYFLGSGKCPLPPDRCALLENESNWNDSLFYEWLNGTEGNKPDFESLEIPDREAFGNSMDTENGYFSYKIEFDPAQPSPFRIDSSRFLSNDGGPDWYTYRIPIRDPDLRATVVDDENDNTIQPEWDANRIQHVRVWFETEAGQTVQDTVEIADWFFVQSNWQDTIIQDSAHLIGGAPAETSTRFVVASISEEDSTFVAPPGVEAYVDPTTDVQESQRGLLLKFDSLDYRDECLATKELLSVDRYSGYRRLRMYVGVNRIPAQYAGKVRFFFRIGTDSLNFYEQQKALVLGTRWDERNYIDIDFNELTALKDAAFKDEQGHRLSGNQLLKVDTTAGELRVKGNPSLNQIKFFAAGVINLDSSGFALPSGEVWLDELRVSQVRRDVGTAGRLSVSGNIADLGNYSFSFRSQDPYFREISSPTRGGSDQNLGSGQTQTSVNYSATLNFDKFLPRSWGARLPVAYNYSKSTQTPLLRTGSDIVLPEEVREQEKSVAVSKTVTINPSFNRKGGNLLFSLLLNRVKTSFSYRLSERTSVTQPYSFGENYNVRPSMDLGMSKVPKVPIFFWTKWIPILGNRISGSELGLYPSSWRISGSFDRNLTITEDIQNNRQSSLKKNLDARMDLSYRVFDNLSASYNYNTRRDLSDTADVNLSLDNLKLGLETNYSQSFSVSYKPNVFSFLTTDFGYQASYSDDYKKASEFRRGTQSRSYSVTGTFDHIRLLGGKSSSGYQAPRSRGGRRAGEETEEEGGSGRPFYDPPLAVLRFLTGWVNSPRYSYSQNYNSTLPGLKERPGYKFQFGLTRESGVDIESQGQNPSASEGEKYEVSTGFTLLGGISTDVRFRQSINRDVVKQGNLYEQVSTGWPELTIRIQRFKTLPLLKGVVNKFIDVFSPRTGYSRSTSETFDLNNGWVTTRSVTVSQSPLLSVNFKVFRSLSLTSSYAVTKDFKEDYNRTTGAFNAESQNVRKTLSASTKYSFSSPSGFNIPLFGKIKFTSTMSISLDVRKNFTSTENFDAQGNITSSDEKSELSITPDVSYAFSQQIRGGLRMRWNDSSSRNRTNHLREVQFWVEIRF